MSPFFILGFYFASNPALQNICPCSTDTLAIASGSGVHRYVCFDGQEPFLPLHVDMLGAQVPHSATENIRMLAKLLKLDLPCIIVAALVFRDLIVAPAFFIPAMPAFYLHSHHNLRPLLVHIRLFQSDFLLNPPLVEGKFCAFYSSLP